jgi:quinoprotein glucose dehydrogenase
VGAKYSPDFTWDTLRKANRIQLVTRTLVRKLVLDPRSTRVSHAVATDRSRPGEPVEFHAKTFVVAAGYTWSSHLLLLSSEPRFADGLANTSGHVGRYLTGHRSVNGYVQLPIKLFPGMNGQHSVVSKTFMRPGPLDKYIRHDLRIWESSQGRAARLRNDAGDVMLGDEILADWRNRTATGTARVRGYYDVIPDRDSRLTLDASAKNEWGDPMPKLAFRDAPESVELRRYSEDKLRALFDTMARAGGGTVVSANASSFQDHPAGGCRMGNDPATSVVDSYGRAHDHENLFVVGAPTCVSGGCANGTLTFIALALRATTKIGEGVAARR